MENKQTKLTESKQGEERRESWENLREVFLMFSVFVENISCRQRYLLWWMKKCFQERKKGKRKEKGEIKILWNFSIRKDFFLFLFVFFVKFLFLQSDVLQFEELETKKERPEREQKRDKETKENNL